MLLKIQSHLNITQFILFPELNIIFKKHNFIHTFYLFLLIKLYPTPSTFFIHLINALIKKMVKFERHIFAPVGYIRKIAYYVSILHVSESIAYFSYFEIPILKF